ncbi:hypothetical protein RHGRI_022531 [Rhododendron griersonianum]|uniref:Protein kinase domain-containing protein n=1 Tax=Rhododendron griersonianum TaxID=479676 RepID=A0AAV6J046_9ERIC|nr:hypothetical protein RHGRI_022531 [Rhododendron griersonianum]
MGLAMKLPTIAAVVLCFTAVTAENLRTFTAMYGSFDSSISDIFQFEGAAGILDNSTLQLTQDFYSSPKSIEFSPKVLMFPLPVNRSGRVMLNQSFKLWEQGYNKTSDRIASFNSSFLFNIDPFSGNPMGEGLAFIMAPNTSLPSNSSGQYLGLTNYDTDGHPENRLFAIELDNVKQDFDPDANHVGLNINSIISNVTASLTPFKIEIASINESSWFYNVWVQYDGVNKFIEVYIAQQAELDGETPSRPSTPILKSNLDLGAVLNQYSYFGFSGSTGFGSQLNGIFRWNLTVDSYPEDVTTLEEKHRSSEKTLLIVGVGVPLLVMGAALTWYCNLCKKRSVVHSQSNILLGALKRLPGTPREFQFKDLKKATNNFDEKKKLGQGGFGVVYRGHLKNENLEVAVKRFSRETVKGQDDFLAELTIINRLRHKHLVPLLGRILDAVEERLEDDYVIEEAEKMLILALACCQPMASERPRTQRIVQIISGLAPMPYVPPFKPVFAWPSMPSVEDNDISSSAMCPMETRSFRTTHSVLGFTPECFSRELCANDKFKTV